MENNSQRIDLAKIIKRLELIKTFVILEDEEGIAEQMQKLEQLKINEIVKQILIFLNDKSYGKAIEAIELFLNSNQQIGFYIDPELEGLKLEAKLLEAEVNSLSNEKADLEKLIHEFGVRHNQELGELIKKILYSRKEKAKGTPLQEEAESDYNQYTHEYEINKDDKVIELSDEERMELKQKYRKASKLCHPDVVSEDQKELADKLFTELTIAYEKNDLLKVREILENLEKGHFFTNKSDAINEKVLLKSEIQKFRLRIIELKGHLQTIKNNETYKLITSIDDWDDYFLNTKRKLKEQVSEY
jgi:hypothetical protein